MKESHVNLISEAISIFDYRTRSTLNIKVTTRFILRKCIDFTSTFLKSTIIDSSDRLNADYASVEAQMRPNQVEILEPDERLHGCLGRQIQLQRR
jgi:hypothetical protein